jgi:transketolase
MDIQKANTPNKRILLPVLNNDQSKKWILISPEYQDQTRKRALLPAVDREQTHSTLPNSSKSAAVLKDQVRIRRPPNAFIIFANEWRKNIAAQNPGEKSKEISTRLGNMWKSLPGEKKELYMDLARKLDAEHKKKYPNYVYCPKEARIKKALRAEARNLKRRTVKSHKTNTDLAGTSFSQQASQEQQVRVKFHETKCPEYGIAEYILPDPGPSWMLVKQESGHQEATKGFQG